MSDDDLKLGPLTARDVHICVDMQRLFAEETDWHTPWMRRVLPNVVRLVEARPAQTICTRFIPARNAGAAQGMWRAYYRRWASMTLDELDPPLLDLVAPLTGMDPPLAVIDKAVFSPWLTPALARALEARGATSLVVSGGETDVCVLATVLGAIDRGYRVVIATDAVCSSADEIHEAAMALYRSRFGQQVEAAPTETILRNWALASH